MFTKNLILAASLSAIVISNSANAVIGPIKITLNPVEVSSNFFNEADIGAPFASEIYTEDDIKNSRSNSIYDFLTQNTSLTIAPSSGNRFVQKIGARGYGLTNGYQNIIITLNGRRLNNIDTSAQELNNIDFNNIKKIEIIKGSGSVIHGDSAMAGVINIYTKNNLDTKIITSVGNYGLIQSSASFGLNQEMFGLNMSIDSLEHGGYSEKDPSGNKDKGEQLNQNIGLSFNPLQGTKIKLDYSKNKLDNRYPNYLTLDDFNQNPAQNTTGRVYTFREANSTLYNLNVKSKLNQNLELSLNTSQEYKDSQNTYYKSAAEPYLSGSPSKNEYDYTSIDFLVGFKTDNVQINSGITSFYGSRYGSSDKMTKENMGVFSQLNYTLNDTIFSLGARKEAVEYVYSPKVNGGYTGGGQLTGDHNLNAFDVGFNTKLGLNTSIFSNLNLAFQAPLIDRFFKWDGSFNGFMSPSKSRTLNIGINHLTDNSKTKATIFRSNVVDEMYYYSAGYINTNLDKTHRQGLELQNKYVINPRWSTGLNYAYTVAKIDEENEASGAYNGKDLPMTSKHNISASINYSFSDKSNITLTQKYRSGSFASEDFSNSNTQKQKAYNSTNLSFSFNPNDDLNFKIDIENLLKKSYGTWLRNDVIYPSSHTRNVKAELSYKF